MCFRVIDSNVHLLLSRRRSNANESAKFDNNISTHEPLRAVSNLLWNMAKVQDNIILSQARSIKDFAYQEIAFHHEILQVDQINQVEVNSMILLLRLLRVEEPSSEPSCSSASCSIGCDRALVQCQSELW